MKEARLEQRPAGLVAVDDGWFVVNLADAAWLQNEFFGAACIFAEDGAAPFSEIGYTLGVVQPGRPSGMYHREANQEDFLVLAGECLLIVEGEERRLRTGDFVHCPPGTEHIFVGAGDGPCVIFMAGSRRNPGDIVYPRDDAALQHGAGVEVETTKPPEAYAPFPKWQPGRPDDVPPLSWR